MIVTTAADLVSVAAVIRELLQRTIPITRYIAISMPFEVLHSALVPLGFFTRGKSSQIATLPGLGILLD